jgi:hypothetical protein
MKVKIIFSMNLCPYPTYSERTNRLYGQMKQKLPLRTLSMRSHMLQFSDILKTTGKQRYSQMRHNMKLLDGLARNMKMGGIQLFIRQGNCG